jgi:anthranilate phosphoribosyltransferase
MVNPSFPKKQLVGVFSLELARLYAYLYQNQEGLFSILHALDGYDEISLTGDFKMITQQGEKLVKPSDINLPVISAELIKGGETIPESAEIFDKILKGKGSEAQNAVVIANAAAALHTADPDLSFPDAVEKARVSLLSGKALEKFNKLVNPKTSISFA